MDRNDQQAIEDLFGKLEDVERHVGPRDPEAEALINRKIGEQAGAAYYMAQTIVAQEHALAAARQRIEELEAQASGSGGFLGAIFGGGPATARPSYRTVPNHGSAAPGSGGSGFLAGAAQTAVGVAGGVFLASLIGGALVGGAQAAEPGGFGDDADVGGDFEAGDSFDGGGFDFGGDF